MEQTVRQHMEHMLPYVFIITRQDLCCNSGIAKHLLVLGELLYF